jgi:WASH complex subunit strumpellin
MATFALLHQSIGLLGLVGLDRMLSFRIVHTLNNLIKFWQSAVSPFLPLLDQFATALEPVTRIPDNASRLYEASLKKVEKLQSKLLKAVLIIGQAALLRKSIAAELAFSSRLDAHLLACAMESLDKSLLTDIRVHYRDKSAPYPPPVLLVEVNKYLDTMGANDPFQKIYMTVATPLEGMSMKYDPYESYGIIYIYIYMYASIQFGRFLDVS